MFHNVSKSCNISVLNSCRFIIFPISRNKYGTKKGCRIGSLLYII
nr:MAG TPA: hypothetical protein [Caudoviricetes sp.]